MRETGQKKELRFAFSLVVGIALMVCFFVSILFLPASGTYFLHFPLLGAFLTGLVAGFLVQDVRKGALSGLLSVATALFLFVMFAVSTFKGTIVFLFFGAFDVVVAVFCGMLGAKIARKRFGAKLMTLIVLLAITPAILMATYDLFISPTKPITHSGDLVIGGNQTLTIERCVYRQDGNIIVKDNASLIIENAEVILDQTKCEYFVDIENQAELIAENASITVTFLRYGPQYSDLNFSIRDHAQATIKETFISTGIHCYDSSQISVYSSRIARIYLCNTSTSSIATVDPPYSDTIIFCYDYSNVTIRESVVRSVSCSDSSNVLIRGSNITQDASISIGGDAEATLSLTQGRIGRWNLYENETIENIIAPNLIVINSTVKGWSISCLFYTRVLIVDSTLHRIQSKNSSQVSLINSTVEWIFSYDHSRVRSIGSKVTNLHPQDASTLFLEDSNVDTLGTYVSGAFRGTIGFNNTTIDKEIYFVRFQGGPSQFYLFGNVTITGRIKTFNGYMTRNYVLITKPNMELNVTNKNTGNLLWRGGTSDYGFARFDVLFTPENYTHTLLINNEKNFNLTSTTPLTFNSNNWLGGARRTCAQSYIKNLFHRAKLRYMFQRGLERLQQQKASI